jgi:hypothetical protein
MYLSVFEVIGTQTCSSLTQRGTALKTNNFQHGTNELEIQFEIPVGICVEVHRVFKFLTTGGREASWWMETQISQAYTPKELPRQRRSNVEGEEAVMCPFRQE